MMLGRSLQGIAVGLLFHHFACGHRRARSRATTRSPWRSASGAPLGGIGGDADRWSASLLNEAFSWRAFFGVNLILLSVAFVLLVWLVPHLPADRTRSVPFVTLVLFMFGIASVTAAIQHVAAAGWLNAATIGGIVVGAALLAIVWLRVRGREPLIAASVMRLSAFRLGTETATLSNWGSGVVIVLVPTALEVVRGVSVLEAGILFLGFSIPFAAGWSAVRIHDPLAHRAAHARTLLRGDGHRHGGHGDRRRRRHARARHRRPRGHRARQRCGVQRGHVVRVDRRRHRRTRRSVGRA